jgi:SLOG cluster2
MPDATASPATLLPARAWQGVRIGVSIGDSEDLPRLGLTLMHQQLVLRELARTVLLGGGALAYGGHITPDGFTAFLMDELTRYAQAGVLDGSDALPELLVCLAWTVHRRSSLDELRQARRQLGLYGELRCLDAEGAPLADPLAHREEAGQGDAEAAYHQQEMTRLRRYLTAQCSARLVVGGRRRDYSGRMPGIVEETLLALEAGQPVFLAAGMGGATLDIAARLDPRCAVLCPGGQPAELPGFDALAAWLGERGPGLHWLDNGLDTDENLRLALTHRPGEVAALVSLGLGRLVMQGRLKRA